MEGGGDQWSGNGSRSKWDYIKECLGAVHPKQQSARQRRGWGGPPNWGSVERQGWTPRLEGGVSGKAGVDSWTGASTGDAQVNPGPWGESSTLTSDTDVGGKGSDVPLGTMACMKWTAEGAQIKQHPVTRDRRGSVGSNSPDDLLVRLEGRTGKGRSWQEIKQRKAGHCEVTSKLQSRPALNVIVPEL